jgi:hypothetical protein
MITPSLRRRLARFGTLAVSIAMLAALAGAASAQAAEPPPENAVWWHFGASAAPTNLAPGTEGQITFSAANLGYREATASAEHPIVVSASVPAGLEVVAGTVRAFETGGRNLGESKFTCTQEGALLKCMVPEAMAPYNALEIAAIVKVTTSNPGTLETHIKVSGGEGVPAAESPAGAVRFHVSAQPTEFGVESYELLPENAEGKPETQAGAHPFQLTTEFDLNKVLGKSSKPGAKLEPDAPVPPKNLTFSLPPGLLGNVKVVPQCSALDFAAVSAADTNLCPPQTALGVARITLNEPNIFGGDVAEIVPVFNLEPGPGEPARFGIEVDKVPVTLTTSVRTGSDYGVNVTTNVATTAAALLHTQLTFWGVPGDPRHDQARGWECVNNEAFKEVTEPCKALGEANPSPFITLPAQCPEEAARSTTVTGESWPQGSSYTVSKIPPGAEHASYTLPPFTGCQLLGFNPSMFVETDTHSASSPTGMAIKVTLPQESTLAREGLAEADVQSTVLQLPEGMEASPAAANGLLTCTGAQVGFNLPGEPESRQTENNHFTPDATSCPPEAKVGSVRIRTPLLKNELFGSAYLASQDTNPFGPPLVLYLIVEDKISGVRVKLAGEVQVDPNTGRLTSVFKGTPPVPFEELEVSLFGGPRASQSTPPLCGSYPSTGTFTPSTIGSGGEAQSRSASFSITSGVGGGPCPTNPLPFGNSFQASSSNNQAGAFTPFSLTIGHADSDQAIKALTVHLPLGAAAMLSTITPCPIAQADAGACGPASLMGHSTTSSGLGPEPFTLGGQAFLTGPYAGAPFGISVLTPAEHVGPFNIGKIIANSTIHVDPSTAQVTVQTVETRIVDPNGVTTIAPTPLPTRIKGFPVQLKQVNVTVDRPGFEFNPTNCNALAVTGAIEGAQGAVQSVHMPFQVTNCGKLAFNPSLTVQAGSSFSKVNGTSFVVTVKAAPGEANIAKTRLVIPANLPSRLTTIQKACPDSVFNANPASCNEGSNIGYAVVHTPVLKNPLTGPAYLVSHGGAAFPDVEFVLQGEGILLILDGQTNIHLGVTTSTFNAVPDAPVSSFEAVLPAGPHSALTGYLPSGSTSLCGTQLSVPTTITGQNGVLIERNTQVTYNGCVAKFKVTKETALQKALKKCKKLKKKSKRVACERAARRKYGPHKKAKHAVHTHR